MLKGTNRLPTFEEYLKLFESIPVILNKIRDMEVMDSLLRYFFSNFTIKPTNDTDFKGSEVSAELKEPWKGFLDNDDLVLGAGTGTLTPAHLECDWAFPGLILSGRGPGLGRVSYQ